MDDQIEATVQRLIDEYFPWGIGHPKPAEPAERRRYVLGWLKRQTSDHRRSAMGLAALIRPVLEEVAQGMPHHEQSRFLFRIDAQHIEKSPESILEKMGRCFGQEGPAVTFDNFREEMEDLGRFRIVANFLSDVLRLRDILQAPFQAPAGATVSAAQAALRTQYQLHHNRFDDHVHLPPGARKKGERCMKGVFYPRGQSALRVEVQIMTMLSESWDKKDHCLIYERRRRGHAIDRHHDMQILALSETLYIVDCFFDGIKQSVEAELRPAGTGGEGCA